MSAVAPATATRPPANEMLLQGSAAANHVRRPKSAGTGAAARTRARAASDRGLPFGQKVKTYLDMMPSDETPPSTRYNPQSASARRSREVDFGGGGVLERKACSARASARR